jgi:hypothetical protein
MLRRFIVLSILALVCFAQHPAWDVCFDLASANITGSYIVPGVARPFCGYDDVCKNLHHRVTLNKRITCNEAFEILTNRNKERFEEPPIVSLVSEDIRLTTESSEIQYRNASNWKIALRRDLVKKNSTLLQIDHLGNITNHIVHRLSSPFPRLVYNEEVDGPMLRNFTEAARLLSREIEFFSDPDWLDPITVCVTKAVWMRQLTWFMDSILWHAAAQPFDRTDMYIVAMAPWLHAYMKTCFYLRIFFLNFYDDYGWILRTASTIYPLYTTERVWYMLLEPTVGDNPIIQRNALLSWDIVEDTFYSPLTRNGENLVRLLLSKMTEYMTHIASKRTLEIQLCRWGLRKLVFAIEYLWFFESINFSSFLTSDDVDTITKLVTHAKHYIHAATTASIMRVFDSVISAKTKIGILTPLSDFGQNVPLPAIYSTRQLVVRYVEGILQRNELATALWKFTKRELSMYIMLQVQTEIRPPWTKVFNDMMLAFVSPEFGLFTAANLTENNATVITHYKIKPMYGQAVARDHLAFGRLLGLFLRLGNPDQVLNQYIKAPRENATVFETLFFGSRIIRHGFYDVYLADSIERYFQNGQELVAALPFLSGTTRI